MTPRRRTAGLLILPLLAVLAACSSGGKADPTPSPTAAATTTVATTTPAGPQAFLADVKYAGFGSSDTSSPAFLNVGNTACQGLADGVSYGQQVQAFMQSVAKPTQKQAETLVKSAVANLCPEYQTMLPAG